CDRANQRGQRARVGDNHLLLKARQDPERRAGDAELLAARSVMASRFRYQHREIAAWSRKRQPRRRISARDKFPARSCPKQSAQQCQQAGEATSSLQNMPSPRDMDERDNPSGQNAAEDWLLRSLHSLTVSSNRSRQLLVRGFEREIVQEDKAQADFRAAER